MLNQLLFMANFVVEAFLHIWPYLLVTIPLAVAVNVSGASRHINRVFRARPMTAILLATLVGAFSPFCSCGVIPVITTLLIGGVPLAPVMSFWIASPSMDPEVFFLSVATLGWELAVWRMLVTLAVSLSAGLLTHVMAQRGWLGQQILRSQQSATVPGRRLSAIRGLTKSTDWRRLREKATTVLSPIWGTTAPALAAETACCVPNSLTGNWRPAVIAKLPAAGCTAAEGSAAGRASCARGCGTKRASIRRRLFAQTQQATLMVIRFMALAFLLEALISLYVPDEWIAGVLGRDNPYAVLIAAALGVPVYASNLSALPMISGLLGQGMNPGAALAFLVAGPTTTLPAMAAVWGIASRRVCALYVSFSLGGAVLAGYLFSLVAGA